MTRIFTRGSTAQIFAASCTGLNELSRSIGRPLILIDVSLEPEKAVDELNARAHASSRRWEDSFQCLKPESGWTDWRMSKLVPDRVQPRTTPFGIQTEFGVIYVPLAKRLTLSDLRGQLQGALRHLQLQAVAITPSFLEERMDSLADVLVHPRYTPTSEGAFRGATLVENIYALDPCRSYWRLHWLVVAARAAAGEGGEACWR